MDSYVSYLIEDLREAAKTEIINSELWDSVELENEGEVEDMAHIEKCFYSNYRLLAEILEIEKVQLPPPEMLRPDQMALLVTEMLSLLKANNFETDFPEGLSSATQYCLLYDSWDDEHTQVGAGVVTIEFCTYDEEISPSPEELCFCRKFRLETEEEERQYPERFNSDENFNFDDLFE